MKNLPEAIETQLHNMLEFYGNRCSLCYSQENLHVHHRNYSEFKKETPKSCVVLCQECHCAVHRRGMMAREWFAQEYPYVINAMSIAFVICVGRLLEQIEAPSLVEEG